MAYRILVTEAMAEDGPDWLRANGYEVKYGRGIDARTLIEDLQDCDGVIPRLAVISDQVISACPRLKVIARHGSGVDTVDLNSAKVHGVRVVNSAGSNAVAVAEHTMLLLLACAKNLNHLLRAYADGHFAECRKSNRAFEISGKTLGLLGSGHVGRQVALMASRGFGMKVLIYDPFIKQDSLPEGVVLVDDRDRIFTESDFVSIHLPGNAQTNLSVGWREFSMMKPTACLVNTSRGTIVDQEAMIKALNERKIALAGLDVSVPEPLEAGDPLFGMDNVIITPHTAGSTVESKARSSLGAAMGCDEILTGKTPTHLIV